MPRVRPAPTPIGASAWLQLMQLASPALPVGGFSYSEGLEAAVEAGRVSNEVEARDWLLDQLHLALGRADLPACAGAMRAWLRQDLTRIAALNDWVLQTRETAELRLQSEQIGRSLLEWLRNRGHNTPADALQALAALKPAPSWPVTFGLAAALTGAPPREAMLAHAFGWAENMVAAAIKAVPLGQSAGQRMLEALSEAIPAVVDAALALPDSRRQAFTPGLAILSSQHEAQYSRLFRS
ncbi:urease accessory protein UreF [Roseateles sp. DAIF2]|uniref:urease accessory protein UreF n=1 Tax=Roseateles sp. DAIF2 TaxID=2714952 RepID=UPI0018A2B54A|nr:urease accessory protein UreF [Roseateles sp. DAIF2]QPF75215.1 urease accessory protein UreF [Roseateles sp. DAIF2]